MAGLGATVDARVEREHWSALLQKQFCLPRGLVGRLIGWFMARDNERMNRVAIESLAITPDDDVLEIGFGPGQAIELIVKRTAARRIAGVDPSAIMVEQARARNRESVDSGRVSLVQATVDALPFEDQQFSKVCAISNFRIWPDRARGLAETRRVMRPGGTLALCVRQAAKRPHWWSSPGVTRRELEEACRLVAEAGFRAVTIVRRKFAHRAVCIVARA